jgi:hypothetical protein
MNARRMTIISPLPVYLDEELASNSLAARPPSLEGLVVGLLPNWRPSARDLLSALGEYIKRQYRPEAVIIEHAVSEVPMNTGKLLDLLQGKLDDLAKRVDVVITATGD